MHISNFVCKGSPFIFMFISKKSHKIAKSLNCPSGPGVMEGGAWEGEGNTLDTPSCKEGFNRPVS